MTEKRFTKGYHTIRDTKENKTYDFRVDVICGLLNELHEENHKIKSLLLKKVEELNNAYNESARAGMPTGGVIGELDSFEEICRIMGWIE